jgi:hypothetical protein
LTFDRLRWEPKKEQEPDKIKRAALVVANQLGLGRVRKPDVRRQITDEHKRRLINEGFWGTLDLVEAVQRRPRRGKRSRSARTSGCTRRRSSRWRPSTGSTRSPSASSAPRATSPLTGVYNELFAEVFREQVAPTKTSTFAAKCLPTPSAASCRHARSSCRPGRAGW